MKKETQSTFEKLFKQFGHRLLANDSFEELTFTVRLKGLLAHYQIDCVLDVGANRGQYANFLREQCKFNKQIISYEPLSEAFSELELYASRDSLWNVRKIALGPNNREEIFNIMHSEVFSSFLDPKDNMPDKWANSNKIQRTENVAMRRLEDETLPNDSRLFLKLDTQGYDLEVLKGAGSLVERIFGIQVELAFKTVYQGAPSWKESILELQNCGFQLSGIYGISYDKMALTSADALFTR